MLGKYCAYKPTHSGPGRKDCNSRCIKAQQLWKWSWVLLYVQHERVSGLAPCYKEMGRTCWPILSRDMGRGRVYRAPPEMMMRKWRLLHAVTREWREVSGVL